MQELEFWINSATNIWTPTSNMTILTLVFNTNNSMERAVSADMSVGWYSLAFAHIRGFTWRVKSSIAVPFNRAMLVPESNSCTRNHTESQFVTRNSSQDEIPQHDVTWRISSCLFTYLRLSIKVHRTGCSPIWHKVNLIQLNKLNLNLTSHNIYSTLMCGLRIFAGPPIYHLPSNVIYATVDFVGINLQP